MADVVSSTSEPALGAIRLAWWRERLEDLDAEKPLPAEWRLQAVASELLPLGVSGRELSRLEEGWLPLLDPFPWREAAADGLRLRGRLLFGAAARVLGADARDVSDTEGAGALWSMVDGARHCSDIHSRMYLLSEARRDIEALPCRQPPKYLRRLTGLAAIAAHDVLRDRPLDLPHADIGRGIAAMLHYLRGTLPRG